MNANEKMQQEVAQEVATDNSSKKKSIVKKVAIGTAAVVAAVGLFVAGKRYGKEPKKVQEDLKSLAKVFAKKEVAGEDTPAVVESHQSMDERPNRFNNGGEDRRDNRRFNGDRRDNRHFNNNRPQRGDWSENKN